MSLVDELPLKPSIYLILLSLVSEARHGYAIRKRVMQHSDNAVRLDPGTLYRHMARLLKVGWIREAQVVCDNDPRRRYYELTDVGHGLLELESTRLAKLVGVARESGLIREGEGLY